MACSAIYSFVMCSFVLLVHFFYALQQGLVNFLCQGPDGTYFQLYEPGSPCAMTHLCLYNKRAALGGR